MLRPKSNQRECAGNVTTGDVTHFYSINVSTAYCHQMSCSVIEILHMLFFGSAWHYVNLLFIVKTDKRSVSMFRIRTTNNSFNHVSESMTWRIVWVAIKNMHINEPTHESRSCLSVFVSLFYWHCENRHSVLPLIDSIPSSWCRESSRCIPISQYASYAKPHSWTPRIKETI